MNKTISYEDYRNLIIETWFEGYMNRKCHTELDINKFDWGIKYELFQKRAKILASEYADLVINKGDFKHE